MIQIFRLDLSLAESYMHGIAESTSNRFGINIQGGKKGIVLPDALIQLLNDREVTIYFYTDQGKSYSIRSKVERGRDIIEVYDDNLTIDLANDIPSKMVIEYR